MDRSRKAKGTRVRTGPGTLPMTIDPGVVDAFVTRELRGLGAVGREHLAALIRVLPNAKLKDLSPYLAAFRVDAGA